MASVPAQPNRRLRSLTLRQALFVFLAAILAALIPADSRAFAQGMAGTGPAAGTMQTANSSAPAEPRKLLQEWLGVARLMRSTMELIDATMAQAPSADELAVLHAQVAVVGLRVTRLSEHARQAQVAVGTGPVGAGDPTSPGRAAADASAFGGITSSSQAIVALLAPMMADPTAPASYKMANDALQQLEALLIPIRDVLQAQVASSRTQPVAQSPAWPASPAPMIAPTAAQDLKLLARLAEMTRQLGVVVSGLSEQPSAGAPQASGTQPATTASAPQGPHVHGSTPPTPLAGQPPAPGASADPMATMMQHMQDMMSMMAGMGSSASPSGSNAASSNAAVTPGAPPAGDASLKRELRTTASTLQVQPLNLGVPGMATLDFYITLDSAGENLLIDLPATSQLGLPSGRRILPLRWVGPAAGKHIEGTLSFALTTENGSPAIPSSGILELMISNSGVDGPQRFTWDLGALP